MASAPPTVRRGRRQKSDVMGLPVHITGSARSEGYYKIDMKDKAKYVEYMKRQLHSQSQTSASKDDKVMSSFIYLLPLLQSGFGGFYYNDGTRWWVVEQFSEIMMYCFVIKIIK